MGSVFSQAGSLPPIPYMGTKVISIIGGPGVGKTSIFLRLIYGFHIPVLNDELFDDNVITSERLGVGKLLLAHDVILHDIRGSAPTLKYWQTSSILIYVLDDNCYKEQITAMKQTLEYFKFGNNKCIIAVNKSETMDQAEEQVIRSEIYEHFPLSPNKKFDLVFISTVNPAKFASLIEFIANIEKSDIEAFNKRSKFNCPGS